MAALIAYTLPAMQLVCHLIASGNSSNDVTNSVTIQLPLQPKHMPLPDGYVAKADLGFAYKYHSTQLVWIKAQNVCIQEGARLAVIDSRQKMNYLASQLKTGIYWVLSGIIRIDDTWINVNTGEIVAETLEFSGSGDCPLFWIEDRERLTVDHCNIACVYFCEIPILPNSTITVN